MNDVLDRVLTDLASEGDALEAMVAGLDEDGWRTPTPAVGWDVATQVGHLLWTDEVAIAAATDKERWDGYVLEAIDDPTGYVDKEALRLAQLPPAELLQRWRAGRRQLQQTLRDLPQDTKLPWFGPPMSPTSMATARFMETWAHSRDVADALGITPEPTDRVEHVVHLGVRTRNYAFAAHQLEPPAAEIRVELRLPSGATWESGPAGAEQRIRGSAYDFALRVTQRRHRADLDLVAEGPDAERWLDVAQAFAGPPGPGREPFSPVEGSPPVEASPVVEPVETPRSAR